MTATRVTFLIVDDDEVSIMAIRRALARQGIENPVVEAGDGLEALSILKDGVRKPFVVLLDINMPRMTGLEFLAALRDDPSLHDTTVFILTTSDAPQDIGQAYAHNVAGYILKEDAYKSIAAAVGLLDVYTDAVVLPTDQNSHPC
jgi:CheY-like chemotaxis protein